MIKTVIAGAASTTILALLIAPKMVAPQAENSVKAVVDSINNTPGYSAEIQWLDSGWFSTEAAIHVGLKASALKQKLGQDNDQQADNQDYKVRVDFSASHGPIQLTEHPGLAWLNWTADVSAVELRDKIDWPIDQPLYRVTGQVSLSGLHNFQDKITPFSLKDQAKGFELGFNGYQGEGQYQDEKLTYQGQGEQFNFKSEQLKVALSGLSIAGQVDAPLDQFFTGVYDSSFKFNLASLTADDLSENNKLAKLSDIYVTTTTLAKQDKTSMDMTASYGVKKLAIEEFNGEDIALDMEINNIDADFLIAYLEFSQSLGDIAPELVPEKMQQFFKDNALALLKAEPELNITSLRGTFEQGKINSTINTRLVGITELPETLHDLAFWLSHTKVKGNIVGDKAVVEMLASQIVKSQLQASPQSKDMTAEQIQQIAAQQAPQMLGMFAAQGLVVVDEASYSAALSLDKSKLTVNDKAIPLPF